MYPCPPIKYPDLEIDEFNLLPVATFISGTNTRDQFLYYFQESNLSPIYLKKLVHNVELNFLHYLVDAQTFSELQAEKRRKSMKFEVLDSQIETRFITAMSIRNLRERELLKLYEYELLYKELHFCPLF